MEDNTTSIVAVGKRSLQHPSFFILSSILKTFKSFQPEPEKNTALVSSFLHIPPPRLVTGVVYFSPWALVNTTEIWVVFSAPKSDPSGKSSRADYCVSEKSSSGKAWSTGAFVPCLEPEGAADL
jgi:hypothetical protein